MKRVLFVCVENACRSQMAEGFARFLGRDKIEVFSAGSNPAHQIDPRAIEVMKEKEIDITRYQPKGLNQLSAKEFDYVISMGCGTTCPLVSAKQYMEWQIADPKGENIATFRKVRDEIELKVKYLIKQINDKPVIKKLGVKLQRGVRLYQAIYADKRTPRLSKWLIGLAIGYALLPFDLIPDFIPVLGHLDDIIIIPLLLFMARKTIPANVYQEHYQRIYKNGG
jgi:arsenate reductase